MPKLIKDNSAFKILDTRYTNIRNTRRESFAKRTKRFNDYKLKGFTLRILTVVDVNEQAKRECR